MKFYNSSHNRRYSTNRTAIRRRNSSRFGFAGIAKFLFTFFVVVLFGYGVYWVVYESKFFEVTEVEILGVSDYDTLVIYEKLKDEVLGEAFFSVNANRLSETFQRELPAYKINELRYTFPSKLSISLDERIPEYNVKAENGTFEIDEEGYVLGILNNAPDINAVIDVIYDKSLEVGKDIQDSTLDAALKYSNLDQNVQIEDDDIVIDLNSGGRVILPKDVASDNVNHIFILLQNIIQKYTIEGRDIDIIDLRFSKPIIKYSDE